MIPKETVDLILDTARIDEVVGEFVSLKKRGSSMIGLCPFHNEKTPSFNVSPARGIYKCFGCSKGGNSVNFVMEHEHLSYPEALRWLAKKYNIEVQEEKKSDEQQERDNERESLFVVLNFAQKHYTKNLHETEQGKAIGLSYFRERGFRPEIIEKFQLGFSPDTWRDLTDAAVAAGYKLENLVKSGLTIQNEENKDKYFDRFKGRMIFPIHNASGRVLGFGGRTLLTDKKVAKYINSPETEVYHKSNVLYGLYFAKKQIIQDDVCYLVEGYTDVLAMHQAGIENAVASSGTALTVEQIRLIRRYTPNITILYDGDPAGIKASFRGIDLILEEGMNVRVLLFPNNDDPDSYSKKVSSEEFKSFIKENTKDFIAFKTELLSVDTKNDPIKKSALIHDIVASISLIPDAITRSVYVKDCSRILNIEEQTLLNELNKQRRKNHDKKRDDTSKVKTQEEQTFASDSGSPSSVQPKVESIVGTELIEREIVRQLLNYAVQPILMLGLDEQGQTIDIEGTAADLIITEIEYETFPFSDPACKTIMDEYINHYTKGIAIDYNYFMNYPDKAVSELTVDCVTTSHQLSNWERHFIYVYEESQDMKRSIFKSVHGLQLRRLEILIRDLQIEMLEAEINKKDDDVSILQTKQKSYDAARREFASKLTRVVVNNNQIRPGSV